MSQLIVGLDATSAGKKMKKIEVLVVEDEPLIRMDITDYLTDQGLMVYEAPDADAAIAILEKHPHIRVMFTDVDMPGSMDGLKLSAAVRNRWLPVKIIVTSGHRMVDIEDIPDGGVFFSKPYSNDVVLTSIRNLIVG